MAKTIGDFQCENLQTAIDGGPRMTTKYHRWIVARAPGKVLVGGLGCPGVGEMWFDEQPWHKDYPGYAEAATLTSTDTHEANALRESETLRKIGG